MTRRDLYIVMQRRALRDLGFECGLWTDEYVMKFTAGRANMYIGQLRKERLLG